MRKGPHPLPVHLGMAAANMSSIHDYASNFSGALQECDAVSMMRGIQMYQSHPFHPVALAKKIIWQEGSTTIKSPILSQKKRSVSKVPLLLVPSLINKANILDITNERSMLRWFNNHGIETYLLDWGDFTEGDDRGLDMDALINDKLCAAIRHLSEVSGQKIDVLGYCMGGTLLLPAYLSAYMHIRRMTLLAAPWDFHQDAFKLARNVRLWSPYILPLLEEKGALPSEWVQALFASLDPNGSAQKFIRFASMDQKSSEAKLFVSVEEWLNDGVDLPMNVARYCIQDWFIDNKLMDGQFPLETITSEILILASQRDQLVPFHCAENVKACLHSTSPQIIELNCGHIGLIVGRHAIEDVWRPILKWLIKE